jgi:hypothetical protein
MREVPALFRLGSGPTGMLLVFPMPAGNETFPLPDAGGDEDFAGVFPEVPDAPGAITCAVSLAVGGGFSVVPAGSATAFRVTDCTEVAVAATGSCAGREVCVAPGAGIVQDAVLLPVTQLVLLNAGAGPAGWAERVTVTLLLAGGVQFSLQTCTVNAPDVPR